MLKHYILFNMIFELESTYIKKKIEKSVKLI